MTATGAVFFGDFFVMVVCKRDHDGVNVARYEDVCAGVPGTLDMFLSAIGLSDEERRAARSDIAHADELTKWIDYPPATVARANELAHWLDAFNYRIDIPTQPAGPPVVKIACRIPHHRTDSLW